MERIINIIKENNNIEFDLKDKVIECVTMIINKYPIACKNLSNNLEKITIRYSNEEDINRLREINADSLYNCYTNTLILNKNFINSNYYKNLLVHELLHVASYDEVKNLGFESLDAKRGLSFNEGMTEYLTGEILNNHNIGMKTYVNDINNITLLSKIIPIEKLIHLYFTEGLLGLFSCYLNAIGPDNNLRNLIISMDNEYGMRVRKNTFNNEFKDEYIKLFIEDISKLPFQSDEEIISTIKMINAFIKLQYRTNTIPDTIKKSVENSYNTILSKSSIGKGKK